MECDREFFVIVGHFLPFYPTIDSKNYNLENIIKSSRDFILLHMCTIKLIYIIVNI